ncbi:MAG: Holliday junction resolvase RuvX [Saccharofermentanales bacterium]|jgi:putative Holliday junction resolvase
MQGRVLAIDYGERRVGLAVSDPLRMLARRLVTIDRAPSDNAGVIRTVLTVCDDLEVATIVVGLPLRTDNRHSDITEAAIAFAEELRQQTLLPVELFDERFTSSLAHHYLKETGGTRRKGKHNKGMVDQVAAEILLQDWLDRARKDAVDTDRIDREP